MIQVSQVCVTLLIIPAVWLGAEFHERGHWLVGKIARSNPRIGRRYGLARRVDHDLEEMADRYIQYSGISPLLWWIPSILFLQTLTTILNIWLYGGSLAIVGYIRALLFYSFIIAAIKYTWSDFIAMTEPEEYVRRMQQEGFPRNWGYPTLIRYLVPWIRRVGESPDNVDSCRRIVPGIELSFHQIVI